MAIGCINRTLNSRPIRHRFKSTMRGARKQVCSPERLRPEKGEKPQARANRAPYRPDSQDSRQALREQISRALSTIALLGERDLGAEP
jgi:hypothetical protein